MNDAERIEVTDCIVALDLFGASQYTSPDLCYTIVKCYMVNQVTGAQIRCVLRSAITGTNWNKGQLVRLASVIEVVYKSCIQGKGHSHRMPSQLIRIRNPFPRIVSGCTMC